MKESDSAVDSMRSRPCGCGSSMAKSTSSQVFGGQPRGLLKDFGNLLSTKNIQLPDTRGLVLPHWLIPIILSKSSNSLRWPFLRHADADMTSKFQIASSPRRGCKRLPKPWRPCISERILAKWQRSKHDFGNFTVASWVSWWCLFADFCLIICCMLSYLWLNVTCIRLL